MELIASVIVLNNILGVTQFKFDFQSIQEVSLQSSFQVSQVRNS
jgi:hypothetical protein